MTQTAEQKAAAAVEAEAAMARALAAIYGAVDTKKPRAASAATAKTGRILPTREACIAIAVEAGTVWQNDLAVRAVYTCEPYGPTCGGSGGVGAIALSLAPTEAEKTAVVTAMVEAGVDFADKDEADYAKAYFTRALHEADLFYGDEVRMVAGKAVGTVVLGGDSTAHILGEDDTARKDTQAVKTRPWHIGTHAEWTANPD
jgi:hypothetical protein